MSVAGLQRAQQLLVIANQQLPSIAQAAETNGLDLVGFIHGVIVRSGGMQPTAEVWTFISALAGVIGPPGPTTLTPAEDVRRMADGPLVPRSD